MRHIFRLLISITLVAVTSCGNDAATSNNTDTSADSTVVADTIPVDTIPIEALASNMGGDTITPADKSHIFYSFDRKMTEKSGRTLSVKETKRRFLPLDPECDGEAAYKVQRFLYLDSLRKTGEEPNFDIGEIADVKIELLDTIRKDENGCWVTWSIHYSTVEACPYATGTLYMLTTYDKNGKQVSTQCMARDEGGADAPISWTCHEYSNIFTDGSFRSLYADSTEDYDENDKPVYSVMRKTFTGQISAAGKITRTELEIERSE